MENQENCSQIEQQCEQEIPQQTNESVSNDTGSANIPGRDNDRKLFVGGLTSETTETDLRVYFSNYGPIDSVKLKIDPHTKRSKGFGFVVFSSTETITKVNAADVHVINNKKVDVQLSNPRQSKIFIGNITAELSEEDIKNYFGQFGNVAEVQIPFDKVNNQRRNFCFVTFNSEDVLKTLLKTPKISINNVEVNVKKAFNKSNPGSNNRGFAHNQQRQMGFSQNFRQYPSAQTHFGQNYDGQNWNSNQMFGAHGYGQPTYGNAYTGVTYNSGYDGTVAYPGYDGTVAYPGYGGFENIASTLNRSNNAEFTQRTGRDAGRGRGRGNRRGKANGGNNGNFRYQPYHL